MCFLVLSEIDLKMHVHTTVFIQTNIFLFLFYLCSIRRQKPKAFGLSFFLTVHDSIQLYFI